MDHPEKLATQGTKDVEKQTQHNMCWTPLCASKNKKPKQDMPPFTINRRQR